MEPAISEHVSPPAPARPDLLPRLVDVHCHLTDTPALLPLLAADPAHDGSGVRTGRVALMGTSPRDWDAVLAARTAYPAHTVAGFGVHPWFAPATLALTENDWLARLEALVRDHPWAFVGEIGMDRVATDPHSGELYDWDAQLAVFREQWDLATRYQRPISMHCVQAQGWVLDFLRDQAKLSPKAKRDRDAATVWPPRIMLHSFTGSPDLLKQLVNLKGIGPRLYFSFSVVVNARSPKFAARIAACPDDRILIESDVHRADSVDGYMDQVLTVVADAKGWSLDDTAARTTENAVRFFGDACLTDEP
ncbi:Cut9-interacting protein scn1 [Blastocladiella emersonii ATCC 22665]|nr:Cut9-interacting protein scn1 [Blastocladiella emersonii ATCC 22665]